jgi:hypothetical protein
MPLHDWTRVSAGTFHDFHSAWIIHLKEALNAGLLPRGYYALGEQHAGQILTDVLTLHAGLAPAPDRGGNGIAVLTEAPPRVSRKVLASEAAAARATRRTLTIRHTSGHRVVALLEILSPANKDRPASVEEFGRKAESALRQGIHLLVVDLFPPGLHDPQGIHEVIWDAYRDEPNVPPADKPLTLASYVAGPLPEAYLEFVALGDPLPAMPLFLDVGVYVATPLEETYQMAYRGVPDFWRDVIEGRQPPSG